MDEIEEYSDSYANVYEWLDRIAYAVPMDAFDLEKIETMDKRLNSVERMLRRFEEKLDGFIPHQDPMVISIEDLQVSDEPQTADDNLSVLLSAINKINQTNKIMQSGFRPGYISDDIDWEDDDVVNALPGKEDAPEEKVLKNPEPEAYATYPAATFDPETDVIKGFLIQTDNKQVLRDSKGVVTARYELPYEHTLIWLRDDRATGAYTIKIADANGRITEYAPVTRS